jgi:hypothetical protein
MWLLVFHQQLPDNNNRQFLVVSAQPNCNSDTQVVVVVVVVGNKMAMDTILVDGQDCNRRMANLWWSMAFDCNALMTFDVDNYF